MWPNRRSRNFVSVHRASRNAKNRRKAVKNPTMIPAQAMNPAHIQTLSSPSMPRSMPSPRSRGTAILPAIHANPMRVPMTRLRRCSDSVAVSSPQRLVARILGTASAILKCVAQLKSSVTRLLGRPMIATCPVTTTGRWSSCLCLTRMLTIWSSVATSPSVSSSFLNLLSRRTRLVAGSSSFAMMSRISSASGGFLM